MNGDNLIDERRAGEISNSQNGLPKPRQLFKNADSWTSYQNSGVAEDLKAVTHKITCFSILSLQVASDGVGVPINTISISVFSQPQASVTTFFKVWPP